jgi:hypothetical protein
MLVEEGPVLEEELVELDPPEPEPSRLSKVTSSPIDPSIP